jgi:AbrB family looped-hinge helix DNA binding protein
MQATVAMTRNGQITVPVEIRDLFGLSPGDYVTIDFKKKEEKKDALADTRA